MFVMMFLNCGDSINLVQKEVHLYVPCSCPCTDRQYLEGKKHPQKSANGYVDYPSPVVGQSTKAVMIIIYYDNICKISNI